MDFEAILIAALSPGQLEDLQFDAFRRLSSPISRQGLKTPTLNSVNCLHLVTRHSLHHPRRPRRPRVVGVGCAPHPTFGSASHIWPAAWPPTLPTALVSTVQRHIAILHCVPCSRIAFQIPAISAISAISVMTAFRSSPTPPQDSASN
ncbi:hypothetical protein VTK56DRAFT_6212 [Thermocarpiscus australiensis]